MLSWKEKVAEKLSRLLADSPSSPSSPHVADSPVAPPESQEKPFSSEELNSTKKSSFSSYFLPFLDASNSGDDGHDVTSPSFSRDRTQFPLQSLHLFSANQIVGDVQGAVFGGLLDAPLKPRG